MPDTTMREALIGVAKITKGTPVDPSTGDGVPVRSFTKPTGARNIITNSNEMGVPIRTRTCPADYPQDGASFVIDITAEGRQQLNFLNAVFGNDYTYTPNAPEAGANEHLFDFVGILNNPQWFTLAYDEIEVRALEECIVKSVEITLDGSIRATVTFVGTKMSRQSTWTNTVTIDPGEECMTFNNNNEFKINDSSDVALSGLSKEPISGFTILIDRGWKALEPLIHLPTVSDFKDDTEPIVQLTVNYPEKSTGANAGFIDDHQNQTVKKAELKISGSDITGTATPTPYSWLFQFPGLVALEAGSVSSETGFAVDQTFDIIEVSAAPTGMSTTLPRVQVINTETDITL